MLLYSDGFWEKVNESVARADQFRNGDSPSLLNEGCHCLQQGCHGNRVQLNICGVARERGIIS